MKKSIYIHGIKQEVEFTCRSNGIKERRSERIMMRNGWVERNVVISDYILKVRETEYHVDRMRIGISGNYYEFYCIDGNEFRSHKRTLEYILNKNELITA